MAAMGLAALPPIAGCAWPAQGGTVSGPEVYVGLARDQAVAVLDPVTDRVVGRISIGALGERGRPWQILVGPRGTAAMLPLATAAEPQIGLIAPGAATGADAVAQPPSSGSRSGKRGLLARRCTWMRLEGRATPPAFAGVGDVAQSLAADERGMAYVLVDGQVAGRPTYAAVVDLARGAMVRHVPLTDADESVLALVAEPEGDRLYAAIWRWPDGGGYLGDGRIVAVDAMSGAVRAEYRLPEAMVATDLALAPMPGSPAPGLSEAGANTRASRVLYAMTASPGPSQAEDSMWIGATQFGFARLNEANLAPVVTWPLDRQPSALTVTADGRRAYMLAGPSFGAPWSRRLVGLDLDTGALSGRWPLPEGCLALTSSSVGKVYVADTLGDRLWRVDTHTDVLLGSIPMPGGPLALTARQA